MTTMKDGVGDDPFADDDSDDQATPEQSGGSEASTDVPLREEPEETTDGPEIPYVLRRERVKDERTNDHVAKLRDEYSELEDEVHELVADEMEMQQGDVSVLDMREAMLEVAENHPDELADVLLGWGYEHRK